MQFRYCVPQFSVDTFRSKYFLLSQHFWLPAAAGLTDMFKYIQYGSDNPAALKTGVERGLDQGFAIILF